MRVFAIGDIHGGLKALIQLLNKLKVTEQDTLIFLGDYVDGWGEAAETVQFLINLSKKIHCIFIKGNHDALCQHWLRTGEVNPVWFMHGGKQTMDSYAAFSIADKKTHLNFFENLPMYYIDTENRLFVHAGFTSTHGVLKEKFKETLYLDRTLWELALALDVSINKQAITYPKRLLHYTEIYIGHTPTTNVNESVPMQRANVWNVDTGAAFKGKVSAINIETKEVVQSDTLPSLYPNEKGRNP